jgi:hypothetical protein
VKRAKVIEPEGFEELWQMWLPHARDSDGRGKARPTFIAWCEAGVDYNDFIDAARYHIRNRLQMKSMAYIELLASYMNGERWKDECIKERAFQAKETARQEQQAIISNVTPIRPLTGQTAFLRQYEAGKQVAS